MMGIPPSVRRRHGGAGRDRWAKHLNHATDEAIERDLKALPGLLDHVDELIVVGVIGGDEPNAADFQIATSVRLLMTFDDLRPAPRGPARGGARGEHGAALPRARRAGPPGRTARAAASAAAEHSFRQIPGVACDSYPMEAATPLRHSHVTADERSLRVDDLVVEDETAARARARARRGGGGPGPDRRRRHRDRRPRAGPRAGRRQRRLREDRVRAASREVEAQFTERARKVAERLDEKVDEVFGDENGHLAKELEKLFSDGSSAPVQNRVRSSWPRRCSKLARGPAAPVLLRGRAATRWPTSRRARCARSRRPTSASTRRSGRCSRSWASWRSSCRPCATRTQKPEELEAERERGTAKGRTFEEQVAEAVDAIAVAQGDVRRGGRRPQGRRRARPATWSSTSTPAPGPARGRIVFEAKDRKLSQPAAIQELDKALAERDADFAVLVVPGDDEVPARCTTLREYNGDKLIVTFDPEDDRRWRSSSATALARARVLMDRGERGRRRRRRDARHRRARPPGDRGRAQGQEPAHRREERASTSAEMIDA